MPKLRSGAAQNHSKRVSGGCAGGVVFAQHALYSSPHAPICAIIYFKQGTEDSIALCMQPPTWFSPTRLSVAGGVYDLLQLDLAIDKRCSLDFLMTTNEFLTLVIASFALFVSGFTFYLTYFHKSVSATGCLAAYSTESRKDPLLGTYEFAVSNSGNTEILVREAGIDLVGKAGNYHVPEIETTCLPTILKPGQIVLVSLDIPSLFMRNAESSGHEVQIQFHVFSHKAKAFALSKKIALLNESLAIDAAGWTPFFLTPLAHEI